MAPERLAVQARTRRIAVVGKSHAWTLILGCMEMAGELPAGLELSLVAEMKLQKWHITGSAAGFQRREWSSTLAGLVEASCATHVFVLWAGNQVNIRGLLLEGPEFDVMLPSDSARRPEPFVRLIPCSAVQAYFRKTLFEDEELREVLDQSTRLGAHVSLLAPPPLLPGLAVRERLARETYLVARLNEIALTVDTVRLVSDPVRLRLRALLLDTYRDFAADQGASFIPPPAEAVDDGGMLRQRYWGEDATHGNAAYGAAYMRKLLEVDALRHA